MYIRTLDSQREVDFEEKEEAMKKMQEWRGWVEQGIKGIWKSGNLNLLLDEGQSMGSWSE